MNKNIKPEKFIFETDFFEVAVNERTPEEVEQDIIQAKSVGYSEGLEKGQQQATEQFSIELESCLAPLKEKLEEFVTKKSELHKIIQEKALIVANQTICLLFKHLEKELNEETLATAISQVMENLVKDVHIVIKVNQKAYDFLNKHGGIKVLFTNKDAELKVDESLSSGECAMEWEDGGAKINLLEVTKSIEQTLQGLIPNITEDEKSSIPPKEKAITLETEKLPKKENAEEVIK